MRQAGTCFHCGDALPAGAPIFARLGNVHQPMCCPGCKAVAEFIHDNDLGAYYEHRQQPGPDNGLRAEDSDWTLYDRDDLATRYVSDDGATATATVDVGGMYCSACAWLFENAMRRTNGIRSVALNSATRRAVVSWDPSRLAFSGVLSAIAAIGFRPSPAVAGVAGEGREHEQRSALRRLIVAAAAGMQVMMFAVALYAGDHFGIEGRIEQFLRIVSLLVCLPIVFYSARPFFEGAVRGLKARQPGMDLPVSLAIIAAFAASTVAALRGSGEIYFDSVAMFVLFLGAARYLEMRSRHRADDQAQALASLLPEVATRLAGDVPEIVSVDRLRPTDKVLIRPGDVIPADGRVLSGELAVDESLLTGESMPVGREAGSAVYAGAINRAGTASVEVTRAGASTSLAEIGRLLDQARADRPRVAQLADRIASRFVLAVLLIAAVTGLAWLQIDAGRAFEIVLATLVVTCPCALSLATPASIAAAASGLAREGILLVRARALEVLSRPARLVFDKTGTLTRGQPEILATDLLDEGVDEAFALSLGAALEKASEHVLARAFTPYFEPAEHALDSVRIVAGAGIEASAGDRQFRLGSYDFVAPTGSPLEAPPAPADGSMRVWLGDTRRLLAVFTIGDELRPDAAEAIESLRRLGHRISIASGDHVSAVQAIARRLDIEDATAALAPSAKLELLSAMRGQGLPVVMVGDGVNDAPVLAAADASIAVDAGTALARASADVIVPGRRLASVAKVAEVAATTRQTIRQNLAWAIGYNLLAIPLAVSGVLAPWMAALGMSASSLLVVLNALRIGSRVAGPGRRVPAGESAERRRGVAT